MPFSLSYSGKGPRKDNQDHILISVYDKDRSIFIVADGMGGYDYGEIAAEITSRVICDLFSGLTITSISDETFPQLALNIYHALHEKAIELSCERMGSTLVAAFISGTDALFFWMGDSRIYHFREGQLIFQSTDHSLVSEMKASGLLSPLILQLYGHIVTRCLSNENTGTFDFIRTTFREGDRIILCSDGVHNVIPDNLLTNIVNTYPISIQPLIDYCTGHARDNYSLILVYH